MCGRGGIAWLLARELARADDATAQRHERRRDEGEGRVGAAREERSRDGAACRGLGRGSVAGDEQRECVQRAPPDGQAHVAVGAQGLGESSRAHEHLPQQRRSCQAHDWAQDTEHPRPRQMGLASCPPPYGLFPLWVACAWLLVRGHLTGCEREREAEGHSERLEMPEDAARGPVHGQRVAQGLMREREGGGHKGERDLEAQCGESRLICKLARLRRSNLYLATTMLVRGPFAST